MADELAVLDVQAPWVQHLERAHSLLHVVARFIEEESEPSAHLAPAARKLESGLSAMYDAFDGRADRVTAIGVAHGRIWEAAIFLARAGLSREVTSLRDACVELVAAEERFPRVPLAGPRVAPLCAGTDRPPLHALERASLAPSFRAPEVPAAESEEPALALPEPRTFEELRATAEAMRRLAKEKVKTRVAPPKRAARQEAVATDEGAPPGFAFAPEGAISEETFVHRWARTCFEEIGMLGVQRAPLRGDDWRACQSLELRMIAGIDAVAALGPKAIAYLEPWAMDAPAADPMRIFAAAMVGGCLEGRDALACAERVLHRFGPGDPAVAEAFASAMKLAPNPFVPNVLRALYRSHERGCRAIAVEVLGHRGWLTATEMEELCAEEDARVFALALPAIAASKHPGLERALGRALVHEDPDVQAAALDAMAIAAHPRAAAAARAAAEGALWERALVRLAIVAKEGDASWLLERMRRSPTPSAIEAVGWAGLVEAVPALIEQLTDDDEGVRFAAAEALDRMLGANLVEEIELEPEALEEAGVVDPNPEPARGRVALSELVSDPRDRLPAGSKDTVEAPSTDPERWQAYWAEHGARFDRKGRYRRGQTYSPSVSLYELDRLALSAEDRRRLSRELAVRTGRWVHFDPHDFVADQVRSLQGWEKVVSGVRVS
ncbi:hypothetical protein KEG38_24065 [Polyangium jinanense]|uniref:HEAT repeat domain-containing protein n=1 Tax=Polyangium jinanense TaxID=2829994 RepID=UPI0023400170|nr:HEAT repeat domain-containing protein [Polyangium jinanense]MDC3956958.1 hypothetical protein [Polyangium jinanense]